MCLVLCVAAITRAEDLKQIRPTGYVTDLAGIIQPQTKTQLEALCLELEQKTGAQMAVVTVKSLDGNDIETYAADLYKQIGIGSKKTNEGVLLLVAPNDRKYRVEVGYGAEPVINDARAGDAGRLMVPYFRQRRLQRRHHRRSLATRQKYRRRQGCDSLRRATNPAGRNSRTMS